MSNESLNLFSCNEVEFIAEEEHIDIISRMKLPLLKFISGDFGPFVPNEQVSVPLWLAVQLRRQNKCIIVPPKWMSVESLTEICRSEQEDKEYFQAIPFHYKEISSLLLTHASADIRNSSKVRLLLDDISKLREAKLSAGLSQIRSGSSYIKLNNVGSMELNNIRPFAIKTMRKFLEISKIQRREDDSQYFGGEEEEMETIENKAAAPVRKLRRFRE